jgi:hypothetical protein
MNIEAPTEKLSTLIWTEVRGTGGGIRIRCNRCEEIFWEGSHFDQPEPGNDWLGVAITHIVGIHSHSLT